MDNHTYRFLYLHEDDTLEYLPITRYNTFKQEQTANNFSEYVVLCIIGDIDPYKVANVVAYLKDYYYVITVLDTTDYVDKRLIIVYSKLDTFQEGNYILLGDTFYY